jgi:transcriptional regulator with XRE-family HTH domain
MTIAGELLRQARSGAGLSQRALALVAGTSQPRIAEIEGGVHDPSSATLDRLLRASGHQLTTLPTRAPTCAATGADIRARLARTAHERRRTEQAFRSALSFSDGLAGAAPSIRIALCVTEPPATGDARFDALLAAVVEHHLTADGLAVPAWVEDPARILTETWTPDPYAGPDIAEHTPAAFRRHGLLLVGTELASV